MSGLGNHDKMPSHKQTHRTKQKHVEHQDATDIQKKLFSLCFSFCFVFFIISGMFSPRNVELQPWYGWWLLLGI